MAAELKYDTKEDARIPKGEIELAARVFYPPRPTDEEEEEYLYRYPDEDEVPQNPGHRTIILVHAAGSIKEYAVSVYAAKLARGGFAAIVYDAAHQGQSGGLPRLLEDPTSRVNDIIAVADWIEITPGLDSSKIGIFGLGEGGGYAISACAIDHRIISLAVASLINIGDRYRVGRYGDEDPAVICDRLRRHALQRSEDARNPGSPPSMQRYFSAVPEARNTSDNSVGLDQDQGNPPSLTGHPRAPGMLLDQSIPRILAYDAFQLVSTNVAQACLVIAGGNSDTLWHTTRFRSLLYNEPDTLYMPGMTHYDYYYEETIIKFAVAGLVRHFDTWLI